MGGSSGGNEKTTQTSSPWSSQAPYLKYGMSEAARLYQQEGPQYYPGSTVAGFSQEQNDAFNRGTQRAINGNQSMNNAEGFSNNVLGGGFSGDAGARNFANASMSGAYGGDTGARNFANASMSGAYNGDAGARNFANASMYGAFGGDAGARGYTNDVLSGKYLNSDPYSDSVFQNIQQKVMPAVNSQFMGSGRYGSNLHADTATRALTESYAPYASQQYQSGLDRMGQAASMSDSMYNNAYGRMAQGAGMADAMYNDTYGRMSQGAGMADSMYNDTYGRMSQGAGMAQDMYQQDLGNRWQAAGMAPTFAANDYTDLGALEAIGQQKQQLGQQELNDAVARWQYYNTLPYDKLGQFLNNIGGNYGGTVVGKQPSNQPSGWQQAAGAGLGLLGLFA